LPLCERAERIARNPPEVKAKDLEAWKRSRWRSQAEAMAAERVPVADVRAGRARRAGDDFRVKNDRSDRVIEAPEALFREDSQPVVR